MDEPCLLPQSIATITYLFDVSFDANVRGLKDLACDLDVAMDTQRLLRFISVNTHTTLEINYYYVLAGIGLHVESKKKDRPYFPRLYVSLGAHCPILLLF